MLNYQALEACFYLLRKDAASGVDGVTFQEYERELESNLTGLVERLKNKGYHAKLVRRQYIPKENGKMRPLGIPALEDKLVQVAAAEILTAIYEANFLPCSYGYRPNLGAKDAVRELTEALHKGRHEFVVEADIKGFFDNLEHDWMLKMLEQRISDGAMLGLIEKWLKAGILEPNGQVLKPGSGTPQGGIVSPVLANVYLHYVLDLWFEYRVRKGNRGESRLFRYADDLVACFDYWHEAVGFEKALGERLRKFGLEWAAEKTKTLRFGKRGGAGNGRFDFLGFEFRWEKGRKGWPIIKRRTSTKKLRSGLARLTEWIKSHRSNKVRELMETLRRKFQGYWNYYGVIGNFKSLHTYYYRACRIVFKWLNRRSQKRSYTWEAFKRLLARYGVPPPRITEGSAAKSQKPCPTGDMGAGFTFGRISAVLTSRWKFT
jgi:group II intron reverse transcriptase/maturase